MGVNKSLLTERIGGVAVITLNRQNNANSLNLSMARELSALAASYDSDASVRAVLLTGAGRFFCAGGDVAEMASFGDDVGHRLKELANELHRAISTLARMNAPLVVAVNGMAAGAGVSLAAIGDVVLVSGGAGFSMAYEGVGLSPDGGSTYFLPRLIGLRKTQELMLTGRRFSAREAVDWGVGTRVVAAEDLKRTATQVATEIASRSPEANAATKRLLLDSFGNSVETQMELEARAIARCAVSANGREGVAAFLQKRPPVFT